MPVEFLGIAATSEGSEITPQQVIDKVGRYHEAFGNRLIAIGGHPGILSRAQFIDSLELFQSKVAPVLRRVIPDPEWPDPIADVRRRQVRQTTTA